MIASNIPARPNVTTEDSLSLMVRGSTLYVTDNKKSDIDSFFEEKQKSLEDQREALKKQYDAALADSLKSRIDGFENTLKEAEESREATKQAEEQQRETTKQESENELEDTDKVETQDENDNELSEAEKKAQEQQQESETETED